MKAPITAIIPYYNDGDKIYRALDSVNSQTLQVNEVVIIDDGSKKFPLQEDSIRKKFNNLNLKFIILLENMGASNARNIGIKNSSSPYISLLDSDDYWHERKIEIQYNSMISKSIKFSFHGYLTHPSPDAEKFSEELVISKFNKNNFISGNKIHTPTVMFLKEHFIPFDTSLKRMEDYKCWVENSNEFEIFKLNMNLANGFKSPLGESGLSSSIKEMHSSAIKAIEILYKEKKINTYFYTASKSIEYLKYPARYLKYWINKYFPK